MNENENIAPNGEESPEVTKSDTPSVKAKERKVVIIIIAIMAIIVLLSIPMLITSLGGGEDTSAAPPLIYFEEPDFDENIFDDPEYLDKDRLVWVLYEGIGTGIDITSETDRATQSHAVNFMFDFIEAQIHGDTDGYNACFSDAYLSKNGKKSAFTMQKLYDIKLEQYGAAVKSDDGGYDYIFILRYKILNNNGTLRDDMPSMSERPLVISVHEDSNGGFAITSMIAR